MKKIFVAATIIAAAFLCFRWFSSETHIRNTTPIGKNIICFGDSLTAGVGASEDHDYPSRLAERLRRPVINAGIPGDTTETALQRMERDVLSCSPQIVFITLGGNDLKNGVPKETAFRHLRMIVKSIQDLGALVVIGGVDIPFWGRGYGDAYESLAKEMGVVLIPNILKGLMGDAKLMSDTIHPNDAGYAIMAERFHQAVLPYLR